MADMYMPTSPKSVSIRPLTTGMVTNIPPTSANQTSFRVIDGYDVTERGLKHHGGWNPIWRSGQYSAAIPLKFADSNATASRQLHERIEDMFHLWLSDGDTRICIVTNRLLYELDLSSGYTPIYWCRTYGVATYNGSGTDAVLTVDDGPSSLNYVLEDLLAAGDWLEYVDGATTKLFRIKTVASSTRTLTLEGKPTNAMTGSSTFKILKPFQAYGSAYVDYVTGRYKAYFVDTYSPMVFQYDGTWLSPLIVKNSSGVRNLYGARTIAYFKERLYFGNMEETSAGGSRAAQRVRWTEVLDWTVSKDANYQDLVFRQGPIQKLLGFGDVLVSYMTDAVYYGRQTNLVDLPYAFYLLETAGIAPVGMKAISSFIDGQIFVGQDDIYYITSGPKIDRIGTAVAESALTQVAELPATRLKVDLINSRVILGIAKTSETLDTMFLWNYKSKGWSQSSAVGFSTISVLSATDQLEIDELGPAWTIDTSPIAALPISSQIAQMGSLNLFGFTPAGHLLQYNGLLDRTYLPTTTAEQILPIYSELVTQDFEFDLPDDDKSVLSFSVRVQDLVPGRDQDIIFRLDASTDSTRTWKRLGYLRIKPGDDEDTLNFRVTGSIVAFRLQSGQFGTPSAVFPSNYEISSYTMRARKRGSEAQRSTTRPQ